LLNGGIMTLITFSSNKVLFRNGAVGTEQSCCCETPPPPPDQPYGECGSECALRAVVGDIESEFGACPDTELPAGWLLDEREGCDPDNAGLVPWLTVFTDPDAECESYQGLLGNEDYPLVCQDYISSGRTVNVPKVFGGYRSFFRSGYTVFPNEDNTAEWVQKSYNYEYEIFFSCINDTTRDECEICGGLTVRPKAWSIHVFFYAAVTETKWDVATQQILYAERVSVRRLGTSPNDQVIVILASCEDTADLTPRTEFYCPDEERPTGCVSVAELFPPVPVEISLSLHDGVTVNENLFEWTTVEDEVDSEDLEDFPDDIKEPGGITIDLAERCCCFDSELESDYCNPLP
jgi:hypothetical protein